MSLSNQEMETVLRCVDKVFDFRAERDRLRDLLAALEAENKGLSARVAELESRTREAEESNANALARLSAAEATIELRRIENEAVRHQVWHAENVCDAMEKRVFDTEARCKRLEEAVSAYQAAYEPDGHVEPDDCFATGPKTGDPIQDLVACPGCFAARKAKEAKP